MSNYSSVCLTTRYVKFLYLVARGIRCVLADNQQEARVGELNIMPALPGMMVPVSEQDVVLPIFVPHVEVNRNLVVGSRDFTGGVLDYCTLVLPSFCKKNFYWIIVFNLMLLFVVFVKKNKKNFHFPPIFFFSIYFPTSS